MNIALIIAGGSGKRMQNEIPKQFINVFDKPVILYTLDAFQKHVDIDVIAVVCIEGWELLLETYSKQYQISKLKHLILGGENGQSSIRNGIYELAKYYNKDDIVLIHDAIRPMVSQDIISDCIVKTNRYGNAITTIPCQEAMLITQDGTKSQESYPRTQIKRTQTPQGFHLGFICSLHKSALEAGITDSVASCTLMIEMGYPVYLSIGSEKNIKLTTAEDLDIFKSLLISNKGNM